VKGKVLGVELKQGEATRRALGSRLQILPSVFTAYQKLD